MWSASYHVTEETSRFILSTGKIKCFKKNEIIGSTGEETLGRPHWARYDARCRRRAHLSVGARS